MGASAVSRALAVPERAAAGLVDGVAVVMPAYQEAANLRATVEDFLGTLREAGVEHAVVVVDDGSSDGTGAVLDALAARHPGRVVAVRHGANRGYGAAVRTGIDAALRRTRLRLLLLTDADGQFRAADLPAFLDLRRRERADVVIGYRRERADPPARRINGRLWTLAARLLLGVRSHDVDCAYKLFDRRVLTGLELIGEAAAIDPELLARAARGRHRIVEAPVGHHPREHGRQTGASPKVVLRSLLSLARVHRNLARAARRARRAPARDPVLTLVTLAASALSAAAYAHYARLGGVLAYDDAVSHALITRRVIDGPVAGPAQLGGVWLPLTHLLALPLSGFDGLYFSGFAGATVSMAAFVLTVRSLYRIAARMALPAGGEPDAGGPPDGRARAAGAAAALLFAANSNVLYLQSTPMTELPLLACAAAAVDHLQRWCRTGRYTHLTTASIATLLATLTRYEGWILALAVAAVVAYTAVAGDLGVAGDTPVSRARRRVRLESHLLFFCAVAFSGIAGWLCWNHVLFGDALNWSSGAYAKPSLWVTSGERAIGDLTVSAHAYLGAVGLVVGPLTPLLALAGLAVYAWRHRLRPASAAPYVTLVFLPFFVLMLYLGQRPLHIPSINGDLYNVRFGLVMALATSVFAGYLCVLVPAARPRRAAVAAVAATVLAVPGTATFAEPLAWRRRADPRTAVVTAWLRGHYDGGRVLMQGFGNESVSFRSRLPSAQIVYEGGFRLWDRALADPAANGIRWIVARTTPGAEDGTWTALRGTPALNAYSLTYNDGRYRVYRRTPPPPPANRAAISATSRRATPATSPSARAPANPAAPPVASLGAVSVAGRAASAAAVSSSAPAIVSAGSAAFPVVAPATSVVRPVVSSAAGLVGRGGGSGW
ncbi:glycosyltransferase family 2 protein [Actinomadura roseirufa]|uniref:glycosyltransferase family 2 protein n=1 Tax=Actinomadura roseirufa TaxID=2094049 RepID=UPI001A95453F|nr:glycosyltransferase family 2 protein [Actinomadura roseirufa]